MSYGGRPCPPLAVGTAGVTAIEPTSLPLGLFCETEYRCRTFRLEPGDTLAVYTDGLSEATDASDSEYGPERLAQVLTRCHSISCEQLAAACLEDLAAFRGGVPMRDDLTLMLSPPAYRGAAVRTPHVGGAEALHLRDVSHNPVRGCGADPQLGGDLADRKPLRTSRTARGGPLGFPPHA